VQVATTKFGVIEVNQEQCLKLPQGMIGFPDWREFCFVPVPGNDYFLWLQSRGNPDLAFLMVDPFVFFPDYDVQVGDDTCQAMEIHEPGDALILTVVTIPPEGVRGMTTNLLAPLVINHRQHCGQQMILDYSNYQTKHPLFHNSSELNSPEGSL
jgi:flagellar assembly factor FliW